MSVFRPKTTKNGVKKTSRRWWIEFTDHQENRRRIGGMRDKSATLELERKLLQLVDLRRVGSPLSAQLVKTIELLPAKDRDKLAKWGLIRMDRVAGFKPLTEHLADWRKSLVARDNTEKHAQHQHVRAGRLLASCAFWTDVSVDAAEAALAELRQQGLGLRVLNYHIGAVKQFCRWMVKSGRAAASPLAHMDGYNADTDRRRERRALTIEEADKLLHVVSQSRKRGGMDGQQRALAYRVMLETGVRVGELRKLTKADFTLHDSPSVCVRASTSKNRKQSELPLRDETAEHLKQLVAQRLPAALVFSMASPNAMSRAFSADLKEVGIDRSDDAGRVVDLHSLRHTFATWLAQSGVHPRLMQQLCRHSTVELTMKVYTHTNNSDERNAVGALPQLGRSPKIQRKTGNKSLGSGLGSRGAIQGQSVPQDDPKSVTRDLIQHLPQTSLESTKSAPEASSEADDSWRWRGDSNPRVTDLQSVA